MQLYLWKDLSVLSKFFNILIIFSFVQNNVVCTLGTESFRPSAAAQCVQLIAMVELPRGLWPGLIQTLVHNVTNPASTEIVKESTLQAIGYICQVGDNTVRRLYGICQLSDCTIIMIRDRCTPTASSVVEPVQS